MKYLTTRTTRATHVASGVCQLVSFVQYAVTSSKYTGVPACAVGVAALASVSGAEDE